MEGFRSFTSSKSKLHEHYDTKVNALDFATMNVYNFVLGLTKPVFDFAERTSRSHRYIKSLFIFWGFRVN